MGDKGGKTCPICTEEMDFTDQQLKPCKCGYEICVWCWHHIMEMAEKDDTGGRCPACRTAYDKKKIEGMAANCERLVAERNLERKQKLPKSKPIASDGKKNLSDIRVIRRNLVYIIGLPLNLADEDLLQHREYFGQYGKVLKVSISRTANGVIQHSSNNSCCVYITYSKEEEAVRCIQSVHGFVLDGRSLRACFGTTKYCHAWLKNLPCSNQDCLYLHDYGSQDDSFNKDDLVSAFARSRVQQIIGATNNMHRRSGNVLPPPVDEYSNINISMAKSVVKSPSNHTGNEVWGSSADNDTGRSILPSAATSWVMCVSSSLPPVTSFSGSGGPPSENPDISNDPHVLASEVVSTKSSIHNVTKSMIAEESSELHFNDKLKPSKLTKQFSDGNRQVAVSNTNTELVLDTTLSTVTSSKHLPCLLASKGSDRNISAPSTGSSDLEFTKPFCSPFMDKDASFHADDDVQSLCSGLSSTSIQSHIKDKYYVPVGLNSDFPQKQGSQQENNKLSGEASMSPAFIETERMEELLGLDDQQLKGFEAIHQLPSISCSPCPLQNLNQSSCDFWQQGPVSGQSAADPTIVRMKHEKFAYPLTSESSVSSIGFNDNKTNIFADLGRTFDSTNAFSEKKLGKYLDKYDEHVPSVDDAVALDMAESSIISNILSLDLDAWDDSLTSPHSLVNFMSETDKQHGSIGVACLQQAQDKNQSRFSFARQEDYFNQVSDLNQSFGNIRHVPSVYSASHDFVGNKDPCIDKYQHIFPSSSSLESVKFPSGDTFLSSKLPVSRAPASSPPGFSVSSRAPPPGFPSHGRVEQAFDISANHLLQISGTTRNVGLTGDVEFIDPAILEVGKGILTGGLNNSSFDMRPTLSPQFSPFEHDARLELLMQQSISARQNSQQKMGFVDRFGNRLSPPNDAYGFSPALLDQVQPNTPSGFPLMSAQQISNVHMSNGSWGGGWNEVRSISGLGISDLLPHERLGCNKFVPSHKDIKFPMPAFSNLPNREFGM